MERIQTVRRKAAALPENPGVYVFLDERGRVLYVGKAKNLRRRVRGYFSGRSDGRMFFEKIREGAADIHFIVTNTEKEALILENNLIKENRPPYNLVFRDDKTFPCLRLTVGEEFPRLHKVRKALKDSARYFGPYSSGAGLKEMLALMQKAFPLRTCPNPVFSARTRPCLRYELGACLGPCAGRIDAAQYRRTVDEAVLFLQGKSGEALAALKARMAAAAEALNFEEAARLRDALSSLRHTLEKQNVVFNGIGDLDAFGLHREGALLGFAVLFVREDRIVGSDAGLYRCELDDSEALSSALLQFYSGDRSIPPDILVPAVFPGLKVVAEILSERSGAPVRLKLPRRGPRAAAAALASKNAACAFAGRAPFDEEAALSGIAAFLSTGSPVSRIECFDASHTSGAGMVGALVAFEGAKPRKAGYRTFRIKTAAPGDDFAMIGEMVSRRFAPGKPPPPDLVLVDGGPPQLRFAAKALAEAGVEVALAGIAKERPGGGETIPDRIWLPGGSSPLSIEENSPGMRLLQRIRDEAHRFAVSYHRKVRSAGFLKSGLEGIPGIGPGRRRALLRRFGSLEAVRAATVEEIAAVKGMSEHLAESLLDFLLNPPPAPGRDSLEADAT